MDANMQPTEQKKYTREELTEAVKDSQAITELIVDMMAPAATVYAADFHDGVIMPEDNTIAEGVFNIAAAMAKRIDEHVQLELARLTQAKEDSGL